ncbi:MAG: hypothetical protein IJZ56_03425 [Oscillospiraceae bacterium]|nr:hypothetical protein [Oscillospiraceae bacterium]
MLERKYLAHYIDAAFDLTGASTNYVKLGEHLEELNVEMNPNVESSNNIWGESTASLNGYEVSAGVDPFYISNDEALSEKLMEIVDNELTGDKVKTTAVDVWMKAGNTADDPPVVIKAVRREVIVAVQSYGGDTSGVQIPFELRGSKNKVKGTFDLSTKKFSESL